MTLIHKPVAALASADIQRLIDDGVPEGMHLDFKRDPIGTDDESKSEFLKDATAFANRGGGDLIIGVQETDGVAGKIVGISKAASDSQITHLENILRSGVEPRLIGHQIRAISVDQNSAVLVVRVPRSWTGPHRVTMKGRNRFFVRNSGGVHEMSLSELRSAFLERDTAEARVRQWRADRMAAIGNGRTPVVFKRGPSVVLHVVSVAAQEGTVDPRRAEKLRSKLAVLGDGTATYSVFNFDGLAVSYEVGPENPRDSYVQVFRDGAIEAAICDVSSEKRGSGGETQVYMHTKDILEECIFGPLPRLVEALTELGCPPPFAVGIALFDVAGSMIPFGRGRQQPLKETELVPPMVLLSEPRLEGQWHKLVRAPLDQLWNSYGFRGVEGFDADGSWRGIS
jgi:hypothetical protein